MVEQTVKVHGVMSVHADLPSHEIWGFLNLKQLSQFIWNYRVHCEMLDHLQAACGPNFAYTQGILVHQAAPNESLLKDDQ